MRILVTLLAMLVMPTAAFKQDSGSERRRPLTVEVDVDAYAAASMAFVRVWMMVVNNYGAPIAIPVCGKSKVCWYYGEIEQKHGKPATWQRTRLKPPPKSDIPGDIVGPSDVLTLDHGESTLLVFDFHPDCCQFADGRPLRYPGKVRLVLGAWPEEKWVGVDAMVLEIVSQEFKIPDPPEVWGPTDSTGRHRQ